MSDAAIQKEYRAPKSQEAKAEAALVPVGEAGDPVVVKILAELDIYRINGDQEGVDAKRKELAELGYKAG